MDITEALKELEKIREEKELSKQKFAGIELDTPYQTYMRWLNGTNSPSGENLAKIYSYILQHADSKEDPGKVNDILHSLEKEQDNYQPMIRLNVEFPISREEEKMEEELTNQHFDRITAKANQACAEVYRKELRKEYSEEMEKVPKE